MYIDWLQIQNVRNLTNIKIRPSSKLNLIIGPNASGKTSILEAIYILSRARSFRTHRINEVIQHDKTSLVVTAGLKYSNGGVIRTGIEKGPKKTAIHYNGENINKSSIQTRNTPLVLIAHDVNGLITGAPKQRRNWLDWAMFHVEPTYLDSWRNYHKALRQRNKSLANTTRPYDTLSGWEYLLAETAEIITKQRHEFLTILDENLDQIAKEVQLFQVKIGLDKGWPGEQGLLPHLQNARETDRRLGFTKHGIHCADVLFHINQRALAAACSRGQIKLFLVLLHISQARALELITGEPPLYLIDDYRAEIDLSARKAIFNLMSKTGAQTFFTATETDGLETQFANVKTFHVERGEVEEVVE